MCACVTEGRGEDDSLDSLDSLVLIAIASITLTGLIALIALTALITYSSWSRARFTFSLQVSSCLLIQL